MLYNSDSLAFEMYMPIAIFRNSVGLDFTSYMKRANSASYSNELHGAMPNLSPAAAPGEMYNLAFEADFDISSPPAVNNNTTTANNNHHHPNNTSTLSLAITSVPEVADTDDDVFVDSKPSANGLHSTHGSLIKADPLEWPAFAVFQYQSGKTPETVSRELQRFSTRQPKGYIDVWWIHDDGGLTLLLPYILSKHKYWNQNKLRVFTVVPKDADYDQKQCVFIIYN